MTKCETIAYYDALGDNDRLLCVDSCDSISTIVSKLTDLTRNKNVNTFHIEVFHNEIGVLSYALAVSDENTFDLWENMYRQAEKASIEEIASYIYEYMPKVANSPYDTYVAGQTKTGEYIIKSFSNDDYEIIITQQGNIISNATNDALGEHILGRFCYPNGNVSYQPINNIDTSDFNELISKIHDDSIRLFAKTCMKIVPPYIFQVPASNESTTRNPSDIADGGLKRHIINTTNLLLYMMTPDYARIKFTQHEIDMMVVACLFHDFLKSGWQADYEKNSATKFNHPRLAAQALRCIKGIIPEGDLAFITNCIESHMGQWNTDPDDPDFKALPVPNTDYKYMVHLADYLATRREISFTNNDIVYAFSDQKIQTVKNFIAISDADVIIVSKACDCEIDMDMAKELGIHRNETDIRTLWKYISETRRVTERQLKYIELAKRTLFD